MLPRLILILLVVLALVLLWKAFGPGTWKRARQMGVLRNESPQPEIKGPDDDPEFLWKLEKERFKERRARQQRESESEERSRDKEPDDGPDGDEPADEA